MESTEQQKVRHKTFTYQTGLVWTNGRTGTLSSEGKPSFQVASPPEFKGEAGVWTPEDLFVGAVEICHMTTFLSFAGRRQMHLVSYRSEATGTLEFIDGAYRFTRIVLTPTIGVNQQTRKEEVHALLHEAHRHCIVSNSIMTIVEINPTIEIHHAVPIP